VERISRINTEIAIRGYGVREKVALDPVIKELSFSGKQ